MRRTSDKPDNNPRSTSYESYYTVIKAIPFAKVMSYGDVAKLVGKPRNARQVGYALAALNNTQHNIPWHRVVNAQYKISHRARVDGKDHQRLLLEAEGVEFDTQHRIIAQYRQTT